MMRRNTGNPDLSQWLGFIRLMIAGDLDEARRKEIIASCSKITAWDALGRFCESHGIAPLVSSVLCAIPGVPKDAVRVFQNMRERSLALSVVLVHQLRKILQELEWHDIAVFVLKGPVYAETIYQNPVLRPFEDLDILVDRGDISRVESILKGEGFSEVSSYQERRFIESGFHRKFRASDGAVVELHWELLPPDFRAFPVNDLWKRVRIRTLYGIPIRTLSRPDEFIYACVHLAKHLTANALTKGIWISDLQRLLPMRTSQTIATRARQLRCRRMVFFAIALAHRFRGFPSAELKPWGRALGIDTITQKLIVKTASPARVFRSPHVAIPRMHRLFHRLLMDDEPGTHFRFLLAYLKRHVVLPSRGEPDYVPIKSSALTILG